MKNLFEERRRHTYPHKIKRRAGNLVLWAEHEDAGPYAITRGHVGDLLATFGNRKLSTEKPMSKAQQDALAMASAVIEVSSVLFDNSSSNSDVKTVVAAVRSVAKSWNGSLSQPGFEHEVMRRVSKKLGMDV